MPQTSRLSRQDQSLVLHIPAKVAGDMTLEFIDVYPSASKQDPATRKKVRVQAMRFFRRQQRLRREDERASSSKNGTSRPVASSLQAQRFRQIDLTSYTMSLVGRSVEDPFQETSAISQMFGLCAECAVSLQRSRGRFELVLTVR